jgi:hypothetical protein
MGRANKRRLSSLRYSNPSASPKVNTFTAIGLAILGLFFMVMSFIATGVRGAFSHQGPSRPPTKTERVICFLVGLAAFIKGLRMLFC